MFRSNLKFILLSILFVCIDSLVKAESANQTECFCYVGESHTSFRKFLDLYVALENSAREKPLSEGSEQARLSFLQEYIFPAFSDKKNPAFRILARKQLHIIYAKDPTTIDQSGIDWKDFVLFLKFYKPGSQRYNQLPSQIDKDIIDTLHANFGHMLPIN